MMDFSLRGTKELIGGFLGALLLMRWEKVRERTPQLPNDFREMQKCIFIFAKLCTETQAAPESPTERLLSFFWCLTHGPSLSWAMCVFGGLQPSNTRVKQKIQINSKVKTSCFIINAQWRSIDPRTVDITAFILQQQFEARLLKARAGCLGWHKNSRTAFCFTFRHEKTWVCWTS